MINYNIFKYKKNITNKITFSNSEYFKEYDISFFKLFRIAVNN